MDADGGWVTAGKIAQCAFETAFALADYHQLPALGHDGLGRPNAEVDALLMDEARDHGKERPRETARPNCRRMVSALARLPFQSSISKRAARCGSVRGSQLSSMPFKMPARRPARPEF